MAIRNMKLTYQLSLVPYSTLHDDSIKLCLEVCFFLRVLNSQALPTPPTEIKLDKIYRMILTNPDYSLYRVWPNFEISWQFLTFCNVLNKYTHPPHWKKSKTLYFSNFRC